MEEKETQQEHRVTITCPVRFMKYVHYVLTGRSENRAMSDAGLNRYEVMHLIAHIKKKIDEVENPEEKGDDPETERKKFIGGMVR